MTNAFIALCLMLSIFLFCVTYILDRRLKRVEEEVAQHIESQKQALTEAFFSLYYNLEDYPDVFEPMCLVLKSLSLSYPKVRAEIGDAYAKFRSDRKHNKQSKAPQKKKFGLVPVVFSLPQCPSDANWAAVDADGSAYWFVDKPVISGNRWVRRQTGCAAKCILPEAFDATDWKHSLIERPRKVLEVTMADLERKYGCKVKVVKEAERT